MSFSLLPRPPTQIALSISDANAFVSDSIRDADADDSDADSNVDDFGDGFLFGASSTTTTTLKSNLNSNLEEKKARWRRQRRNGRCRRVVSSPESRKRSHLFQQTESDSDVLLPSAFHPVNPFRVGVAEPVRGMEGLDAATRAREALSRDQRIGVASSSSSASATATRTTGTRETDMKRIISSLVQVVAGISRHDNAADLVTSKPPIENADADVILQIFGWIHPSQVFKYRRLNRRINQLLLTDHFAVSVYAARVLANDEALEWSVANRCTKVQIPPAIWELSKLERLQLTQASFSILPDIIKLVNLKHLDLTRGYYAGTTIPAEIWQLSSLETLYLTSCSFNGELSKDVAKLVNLEVLSLAGNRNLGGSIPCEIGAMTQLTVLDLASCNFSGMIPNEIGALLNLKTLDLSDNMLSEEVSSEILCHLVNLEELLLNNNKLSGVFPQEYRNLKKIRSCKLQKNPDLAEDL
ncbi:L domain-like protein [Rhizoclosmatium globosum]|uniref:L domain-like protein n=1 Tax=Rhizoclosmatium globosum TaxID=329046 RepID=A0A1Y2BTS5_9FUNG|nr:L domain-like protein [Rhizoclosmatium globosum]|eukprot:ORY38149.1 L domain-like protein [Rhizoclosmatium globosum]